MYKKDKRLKKYLLIITALITISCQTVTQRTSFEPQDENYFTFKDSQIWYEGRYYEECLLQGLSKS